MRANILFAPSFVPSKTNTPKEAEVQQFFGCSSDWIYITGRMSTGWAEKTSRNFYGLSLSWSFEALKTQWLLGWMKK